MTCTSCGAVNPPNMRFCGMCGAALRPKQQPSRRERRRVSVVFIDLARFTTLTHGFDPEGVRDLADEVLTVVAGVIEDYDGHVDAFRGDGLIALFGAPHSHPDDPQRAVMAAAACLKAIETIGESKGFRLLGRAGVNTGVVIAGSVGSGRVRDYTVMGSTVNLAARLEAAAEVGSVWVGPETYEATRHRLLYQATPPVELAGFPNVTEAYRLISTLEHYDADPYGHIGFVGRERERATLLEAFDRVVTAGRPQELWLVGEAGSGKTRLLRELRRDLEARGALVLWHEGRPSETFCWEPLARQIFGLSEGEETRVQQQRISAVLQQALPDRSNWHHHILSSLGLAKAKTWTRLERRTFDRINVAWADLFGALPHMAGGPQALVLIVENSPQDASLLEFLQLLQRTEAPLLLIRSSRGRDLPENAATIQLTPLTLDESLTLLNQVASPALKVATESLVYQVGGVPAYVLELGRALSITQGGSFSGSLASLLQARLDMLEPELRRLLAHAALCGERVWRGLLLELMPNENEGLIRGLTDDHLLVTQPASGIPDETEYRFQSELLRQAVLRMIPYSDRPLVHLRIAAWLEQHAPLSHAELTASHFLEGGSQDAAYPHLLTAADHALRNDPNHAFALFDDLKKLTRLPPELQAQAALAHGEAALQADARPRALRELAAARRWIEACDGAAADELQSAYLRLCHDAGVNPESVPDAV